MFILNNSPLELEKELKNIFWCIMVKVNWSVLSEVEVKYRFLADYLSSGLIDWLSHWFDWLTVQEFWHHHWPSRQDRCRCQVTDFLSKSVMQTYCTVCFCRNFFTVTAFFVFLSPVFCDQRVIGIVFVPENLHTHFELSAQAWTLYKAP
jgi:hypothetical protein